MITTAQYFGRETVNEDIAANAKGLLEKVNALLEHYEGEVKMTSGYRSPEHNKSIGGARSSKHMSGEAIDIFDPSKALAKFVFTKQQLLADYGLYCEDIRCTKNWVHFQSKAPKSGSRFFIPSLAWAAKLNGPLTLESL